MQSLHFVFAVIEEWCEFAVVETFAEELRDADTTDS